MSAAHPLPHDARASLAGAKTLPARGGPVSLLALVAGWRQRARNRDELVKAAQAVTETQWEDHRADAFRTCAAELEEILKGLGDVPALAPQAPPPAPVSGPVETAQNEAEIDDDAEEELTLALTPSEPGAGPKKRATKAKEPPAPTEPPRVWSAQQLAIFAEATGGSGHLAIEALAGTGKTTALVEIVKRLPPEARVLVLAFGKEIAAELARKMPKGTKVATTHGLGHQALQARYGQRGPDFDKMETILRGEEFFPLVKEQRARRRAVKKLVEKAKLTLASTPEEALALCPLAKVDPYALDPDAETDQSPGADERRKRAKQALGNIVIEAMNAAVIGVEKSHDLDDMLFLPYALGMRLGEFDYVLVDEAQDLSRLQIELIFRCLAPGGRVFVVGDPRQAIFAFRGADPQAWKILLSRLGAKALPLSTTYRCSRAIVKLANKEVPALLAHEGNSEGAVVQRDRVDIGQLEPGDFVISRSKAPLIRLCLRALAAGKKAALVGKDIGKEIDDQIVEVERSLGAGATVARVRDAMIEQARKARNERDERGQDTRESDEEIDMIDSLFQGKGSVEQVRYVLSHLATEGKLDKKVAFLTAHRAKGLEADRVWMLDETFRGGSQEENNLWYVATTRARHTIFLAGGR